MIFNYLPNYKKILLSRVLTVACVACSIYAFLCISHPGGPGHKDLVGTGVILIVILMSLAVITRRQLNALSNAIENETLEVNENEIVFADNKTGSRSIINFSDLKKIEAGKRFMFFKTTFLILKNNTKIDLEVFQNSKRLINTLKTIVES